MSQSKITSLLKRMIFLSTVVEQKLREQPSRSETTSTFSISSQNEKTWLSTWLPTSYTMTVPPGSVTLSIANNRTNTTTDYLKSESPSHTLSPKILINSKNSSTLIFKSSMDSIRFSYDCTFKKK